MDVQLTKIVQFSRSVVLVQTIRHQCTVRWTNYGCPVMENHWMSIVSMWAVWDTGRGYPWTIFGHILNIQWMSYAICEGANLVAYIIFNLNLSRVFTFHNSRSALMSPSLETTPMIHGMFAKSFSLIYWAGLLVKNGFGLLSVFCSIDGIYTFRGSTEKIWNWIFLNLIYNIQCKC